MCVPVSVSLVLDWPIGSKCSFRTSEVALPREVSGQWLLEGGSHRPSCHWEAPPTASTLKRDNRKPVSFSSFVIFRPNEVLRCRTPVFSRTFVQHGIGWFVPRHGFFAEVLVGLSQTLHLTEARVEGHWRVGGVFSHVEVSSATQLLLNYQSLLQQLVVDREKEKKTLVQCPVFPLNSQQPNYNVDKSHHFE